MEKHGSHDKPQQAHVGVLDEQISCRMMPTDYMRHGYGVPSMGSLVEHTEDLLALHRAFDDAHFVIHQMIAEGDTVAVRYTFIGVHTGDYNGATPTGNRVSRASAAVFTIRDGKVAESHIFAGPRE